MFFFPKLLKIDFRLGLTCLETLRSFSKHCSYGVPLQVELFMWYNLHGEVKRMSRNGRKLVCENCPFFFLAVEFVPQEGVHCEGLQENSTKPRFGVPRPVPDSLAHGFQSKYPVLRLGAQNKSYRVCSCVGLTHYLGALFFVTNAIV